MRTSTDEQTQPRALIEIARRVYDRQLTAAAGGNISVRLDDERFLISRSGSSFGFLSPDDILKVRLNEEIVEGQGKPSSEMPVHAAVYRELSENAVVHAHPPLISALALTDTPLTPLVFEHYVVLGDTPVVPQHGPNITEIEPIVEALKNNKIVILQHHGVIAAGKDLEDAFLLTDLLETSARTIMAILGHGPVKPLPGRFYKKPAHLRQSAELFSEAHATTISGHVNKDKDMTVLGKQYQFSATVCLSTVDTGRQWYISVKDGRIERIEFSEPEEEPTFTFWATHDMWIRIFTGRTNLVVGVYQGRVSMEGDVRKMSQWYVPIQCMFECMKVKQ